MDAATRDSAGALVESTNKHVAIYNFELIWFTQFWPPSPIQVGVAFKNDVFKSFLQPYDIENRPIPPIYHSKNPVKLRYGITWSISYRLKSVEPQAPESALTNRAVCISSDLYESNNISAFEVAKGFYKPLVSFHRSNKADYALKAAQDELLARHKLPLVFGSNKLDMDPLRSMKLFKFSCKMKIES